MQLRVNIHFLGLKVINSNFNLFSEFLLLYQINWSVGNRKYLNSYVPHALD